MGKPGAPVTIKQIEEAFGLPVKEWAGKCYQVACAAAELIPGSTAVYGHFLGEVHPSSIFAGRAMFVQHGWVVLKNGRVLDPTRWAFEGKKPYLYVGKDDVYDEGGNQLRAAMQGGPPRFDPEEKTYEVTKGILPTKAWNWLEKALGLDQILDDEYEPGMVTEEQLRWVAHLDPRRMDGNAKEVFAMLDSFGMRAFIPFDNWRMVEQGRT